VDWSKYSKGIPFRIVQGSGDDNALGVLKFNFPNKYAVYLHDTNQRYYFSRADRALSHGCVRVQEWDDVALYLLRNDSLNAKQKKPKGFTPIDSVLHWLAVKEKHTVPLRNRIPIFIRYFTCESDNGHIVFFGDVYNEDKKIKEQFFPGK
ncbi:MAG: murein L,D-transpeptidase, partial [Chitinophagaceae bacterium]